MNKFKLKIFLIGVLMLNCFKAFAMENIPQNSEFIIKNPFSQNNDNGKLKKLNKNSYELTNLNLLKEEIIPNLLLNVNNCYEKYDCFFKFIGLFEDFNRTKLSFFKKQLEKILDTINTFKNKENLQKLSKESIEKYLYEFKNIELSFENIKKDLETILPDLIKQFENLKTKNDDFNYAYENLICEITKYIEDLENILKQKNNALSKFKNFLDLSDGEKIINTITAQKYLLEQTIEQLISLKENFELSKSSLEKKCDFKGFITKLNFNKTTFENIKEKVKANEEMLKDKIKEYYDKFSKLTENTDLILNDLENLNSKCKNFSQENEQILKFKCLFQNSDEEKIFNNESKKIKKYFENLNLIKKGIGSNDQDAFSSLVNLEKEIKTTKENLQKIIPNLYEKIKSIKQDKNLENFIKNKTKELENLKNFITKFKEKKENEEHYLSSLQTERRDQPNTNIKKQLEVYEEILHLRIKHNKIKNLLYNIVESTKDENLYFSNLSLNKENPNSIENFNNLLKKQIEIKEKLNKLEKKNIEKIVNINTEKKIDSKKNKQIKKEIENKIFANVSLEDTIKTLDNLIEKIKNFENNEFINNLETNPSIKDDPSYKSMLHAAKFLKDNLYFLEEFKKSFIDCENCSTQITDEEAQILKKSINQINLCKIMYNDYENNYNVLKSYNEKNTCIKCFEKILHPKYYFDVLNQDIKDSLKNPPFNLNDNQIHKLNIKIGNKAFIKNSHDNSYTAIYVSSNNSNNNDNDYIVFFNYSKHGVDYFCKKIREIKKNYLEGENIKNIPKFLQLDENLNEIENNEKNANKSIIKQKLQYNIKAFKYYDEQLNKLLKKGQKNLTEEEIKEKEEYQNNLAKNFKNICKIKDALEKGRKFEEIQNYEEIKNLMKSQSNIDLNFNVKEILDFKFDENELKTLKLTFEDLKVRNHYIKLIEKNIKFLINKLYIKNLAGIKLNYEQHLLEDETTDGNYIITVYDHKKDCISINIDYIGKTKKANFKTLRFKSNLTQTLNKKVLFNFYLATDQILEENNYNMDDFNNLQEKITEKFVNNAKNIQCIKNYSEIIAARSLNNRVFLRNKAEIEILNDRIKLLKKEIELEENIAKNTTDNSNRKKINLENLETKLSNVLNFRDSKIKDYNLLREQALNLTIENIKNLKIKNYEDLESIKKICEKERNSIKATKLREFLINNNYAIEKDDHLFVIVFLENKNKFECVDVRVIENECKKILSSFGENSSFEENEEIKDAQKFNFIKIFGDKNCYNLGVHGVMYDAKNFVGILKVTEEILNQDISEKIKNRANEIEQEINNLNNIEPFETKSVKPKAENEKVKEEKQEEELKEELKEEEKQEEELKEELKEEEKQNKELVKKKKKKRKGKRKR